jgi:hypothetical protein
MTHLDISKAKAVSTLFVVERRLIETLLLTLEPRTQTWNMDNETLLLCLEGQIIHHSQAR